eukprot:GFUD01020477.1.p1 GENE.GFUD01020477.1~~GFUD01020477.1.p1  ORF type:complete len:277 (+),score=53.72 GFUD01020477.1:45-875(+)
MTSSAKYCLKVDDFDANFVESFRELRASEDLFDVTLVSDDANPIQAHKLVLSASSLFFKNILKFNKNNHPLLYIRGLSEQDLNNVLEFLYNGEVQVAHEELDKFLEIAKDLKLRGMYENDNLQTTHGVTNDTKNESKKKTKLRKTRSKTVLVTEDKILNVEELIEVKQEDFTFDNLCTSTVVAINDSVTENLESTDMKISVTEHDELDAKIQEMMFKENRLWHCKMCNKSKAKRSNIVSHVETKHLENSIPCKFCETIARNRPALAMHVRSKHTTG